MILLLFLKITKKMVLLGYKVDRGVNDVGPIK